ncbi:hypothetical protein BJX64DRAFT_296675 [Aspergillus heterothallicus]
MMHLPAEIIQLIVEFLRDFPAPKDDPNQKHYIAPYALISRQWQAVVERIIWHQVTIKGTEFSLELLKQLTSGDAHRCARVGYMRHLVWLAADPVSWKRWLEARDGNPSRQYSDWYDEQFSDALQRLFKLLDGWRDQETSLELSLRISGHWVQRHEPSGEEWPTVTLEQVWRRGLEPYPPHLSDDALSHLPALPYITSFRVHDAWICSNRPSTFLGLLSRFPRVRYVCGGEGHGIPPQAHRALLDQRQELSDGLSLVPESVEMFEYKISNRRELSYSPEYAAANYLNSQGLDELSIAFRSFSTRLRKMKLEFVRISSALFWPSAGGEELDTACMNWPKLEELLILQVPPYAANGEWIIDNDPERFCEAEFDEDPEEGWCYESDGYGLRGLMRSEEADKMYAAIGHAAKRMPRLKRLEFSFRAEVEDHEPTETLQFETNHITGKSQLEIRTSRRYKMGERVITAWGLQGNPAVEAEMPIQRLDQADLFVDDFRGGHWNIEYPKWP